MTKMKGCRPLDTNEILKIAEQFDGVFEIRNRSLFMLGVSVGGRISELLALKIEDVWQNGQPVSDLLFQKNVVKGKETARMIPVNDDGQEAIRELIQWHKQQFGNPEPRRPLFMSRQGGEAREHTELLRDILESVADIPSMLRSIIRDQGRWDLDRLEEHMREVLEAEEGE